MRRDLHAPPAFIQRPRTDKQRKGAFPIRPHNVPVAKCVTRLLPTV